MTAEASRWRWVTPPPYGTFITFPTPAAPSDAEALQSVEVTLQPRALEVRWWASLDGQPKRPGAHWPLVDIEVDAVDGGGWRITSYANGSECVQLVTDAELPGFGAEVERRR